MGTERSDRPIDDAIVTAAERTRAAELEFIETPVDSGHLTETAEKVEHRAEDLAELASDEAAHPRPSVVNGDDDVAAGTEG